MKLFPDCDRAAHDPAFSNPMHLVHPEHGAAMVFDIFGMAVCATCGTRWMRERNHVVLVERKPPKRATPVVVKGRKPPKRVTSGKHGN